METYSIKDVSQQLKLTNGRIYQIVRKLHRQGKIAKDQDGKYILNDKALHEIQQFYFKNGYGVKKQKLVKSENKVKELQGELESYKNKINSLNQIIDAKNETIKALKENSSNTEDFKNTIQSALKVLDQSQSLHYMDKLPQNQEAPAVEDQHNKKYHWWEKIFK